MAEAKWNDCANALKERIESLRSEFGFSPGALKGSLAKGGMS